MKVISRFLTIVLPLVVAELDFIPSKNQQGRNLRRFDDGLNGCWGQFHQFGFCVQKINEKTDSSISKVKFMPCDSFEPDQMWKFQHDEVENWNKTGLVYNMNGGCLAVRGDIESGKNLKVIECNENDDKQLWWSDGDSLTLLKLAEESRESERCVQAESFPINERDPVVVSPLCSDSLDN